MRRGIQGVDTKDQLRRADGHLVDMLGRTRLEVPKSFDTHHGDGVSWGAVSQLGLRW